MKTFFVALFGVGFLFAGYFLLRRPRLTNSNASAIVPPILTPQTTTVPGTFAGNAPVNPQTTVPVGIAISGVTTSWIGAAAT